MLVSPILASATWPLERCNSPGLRGPVELLIPVAPGRAQLRDRDAGQDLARRQGGGQVVDEEVGGRYLAFARRPTGDHRRVHCEDYRGHVAGRIGVRYRATHRAAMPYGRVSDQRGGLRQQAGVLGDQRIVDELVKRRASADQQVITGVGHAAQLIEGADVDQQIRIGQPQPEQRQQTLPASDDLRVLATVGERAHRVVQ